MPPPAPPNTPDTPTDAPLMVSVSGVRGVVGRSLTPEVVLRFAGAFAASLDGGPAGKTVVLSRDGRPHGPMLHAAMVAGLTAAGCRVLDLGVAATPTCGFMVKYKRAAGGVQITASHNPPEWNGLKLFRPEGFVLSPAAGRRVADLFAAGAAAPAAWDQVGDCEAVDDPHGDHLHRVTQLIDAPAVRAKGFAVVLDANHGAGAAFGPRLLAALGCRVEVLGGVADGRFDHPPEPTAENLPTLGEAVRRAGAAVGFAVDPDADRLALVDDRGRYIGEELTLALAILARTRGGDRGPVVLNQSTSLVSQTLAERAGCPVWRTPVGEVHVAEKMIASGALIGGEGNGGVIDPRVGLIRDSAIGMALVLDHLAATGEPLSSITDGLPVFHLEKTKYPLDRARLPALLDATTAAFPGAAADRSDGLRLALPGAWLQVRGSNTEPIVRVFAESADPTEARRLCGVVAGLL